MIRDCQWSTFCNLSGKYFSVLHVCISIFQFQYFVPCLFVWYSMVFCNRFVFEVPNVLLFQKARTELLISLCWHILYQSYIIVTRNNIVWKLARGYCLCYCKTFLLVPDSTECTNFFLPKCAVHYLYHLKSNNIVSQR